MPFYLIGVVNFDNEQDNHKMFSFFFNNLFIYNLSSFFSHQANKWGMCLGFNDNFEHIYLFIKKEIKGYF